MTKPTEIKTADKYYFIVSTQTTPFKTIHELVKELGGFYNGAGWCIPGKHKDAVTTMCSNLNNKPIEMMLEESFDNFRRMHNIAYFNEKSIKLNLEIDKLKQILNIEYTTNDSLPTQIKDTAEGKKILTLLDQKQALQDQITRANNEEEISKLNHSIPQIVPIAKRIESHNNTLKKYRGKKHLGLCVKTITEFNDKMLGLRKLILLAAAPNVGKTALTIQLALEVLLKEPDSCLIYVSLEMDAEEIFTRMNLYFSGLNFNAYVLGSQQIEDNDCYKKLFTPEELKSIENATKKMEEIGDRLQIIDMSSCSCFNSKNIIEYVEKIKKETKCQRAIVVVDYLQVWPIPTNIKLTSDVEADKWRIGEIKKIRDALNVINQDPVIVISEARKPAENATTWGGELSDVMGSARGTYTPDAVLLLNQLTPKQLLDIWDKHKIPPVKKDIKDEERGVAIRDYLSAHGIALCSLKMAKGRDGMQRFDTILQFYFQKNTFKKFDCQYLLGLVMKEKTTKSRTI